MNGDPRDEQLDLFTLVVTLLVMPWIVHVLHAPLTAVFVVAICCWPLAGVGSVMLYQEIRSRREQRK